MLTIRNLRTFNPVTFSGGCMSRQGGRVFRGTQKPPFFFTGPVYNCQRPPVHPVFKRPDYNTQRPQQASEKMVRDPRKFHVQQSVRVEIAPSKTNQPVGSINGSHSVVSKNVSIPPAFNWAHRVFNARETMEAYRARKSSEKKPIAEPVNRAESSVTDNFSNPSVSPTPHQGESVNIQKIEALLRSRKSREDGLASEPVNSAGSSVPDKVASSLVSSTPHQEESVDIRPLTIKQQVIDIIVKDIQTNGSWDNTAGEIAVRAITDLPSWPQNKHLQVNVSTWLMEYGKQAATSPVILQLQQSHYGPVIEDQRVAVAGDGNCFYHSLLLALSASEQQQLLGTAFIPYDRKSVADDRDNPNVMALRQLLASHVQRNISLIRSFQEESGVTDEKIIQEHERDQAQQTEGDEALAREL